MGRRVDFYNDENAPIANALVPAVSAVVAASDGRILLQRRSDNGLWALPGGGIEMGESVTEAIVREVLEETGLVVRPRFLIGVYSDPGHVFAYEDGEVRQEFSVCAAAEVVEGSLAVSEESTDVAFFDPTQIPQIPMHPRIWIRIEDYLANSRALLR